MNKSLTLNDRHSTQCHWPCTSRWGQSDWPCKQVLHHTKSLFSYPILTTRNNLLYYTKKYIHHLPTYLVVLLNKTHFYRKCCYSEKLQMHLEEEFASRNPKIFSVWNHLMYTEKEHAQPTLYKPHS